MASYLAQEVQLAKRHEEILSQRLVLLQQMENNLKDREAKKTWQMQEADEARKRNVALLNDIEAAGKKLQARDHLLLHPDTVNLKTHYWVKVEESIPKWELFFLGRTQAPVGVRNIKPEKQKSSFPKGLVSR